MNNKISPRLALHRNMVARASSPVTGAGSFSLEDKMKTGLTVKRFDNEHDAVTYWQKVGAPNGSGLLTDGRRVKRNELIYNKDNTFTVETEVE